MMVLITNKKKPNVNIVIGIVSKVNKGLIKIFSKPITATNNIAERTSNTSTNQNKYVQPNTTATLNAIFNKICNIAPSLIKPKIQKLLYYKK
jgi:hypothetical protein